MANGRIWTNDEISKLSSLFSDGISDFEISNILCRSVNAIKNKRKKLRIIGDPNNRRISSESRKLMSEKRKKLCGHNHPMWKGGRRISTAGYVEIRMKDHHRSRKNGYVFEHILVAEKKIGRRLLPHEQVHHLDEDKKNNDPNNLVVVTIDTHHKFHPRKKSGLIKKCIICESTYYVKRSSSDRSKCCSRSCSAKYSNKLRGERKHA